jgi:polar amino acid transport system substrate-binding protein
MTPDVLPHVFEPFYSTRPEGLGLGLFISRNIVEQHGGQIGVHSRVGEGTTFTVWLPA